MFIIYFSLCGIEYIIFQCLGSLLFIAKPIKNTEKSFYLHCNKLNKEPLQPIKSQILRNKQFSCRMSANIPKHLHDISVGF